MVISAGLRIAGFSGMDTVARVYRKEPVFFNQELHKETVLAKRPITPAYIIFYILFLPDSWRILAGIAAAVFLTRYVTGTDMDAVGRVIMFVMLAAIGYAGSGVPARFITGKLKKWFLGDRYG